MIQSVGVPLLHGWLFISGVCFVYLMLLPKLKLGYRQRQIFFVGIGAVMLALYLWTESLTPQLFSLLIVPACLLCVMLLDSRFASGACVAIVAASGYVILGPDCLPVLVAGFLQAGLGMYLSRRHQMESAWLLYLYSFLCVAVYLLIFFAADSLMGGGDMLRLPGEELAIFIASSILSSQMIPLVFTFVKDQARLQRELILSEKYQSVGQMAASISHEIRNPLTTARGFLQLMNIDKLSKENFERYRRYAFEGLDHANQIITEYLNYTKPSVETAKRLDVKHEIDSVVQWLQPYSVQKNVTIVTHHMSEADPFVFVQPKQFQQCMLNIMKNAIEAMVDGGLLTVHTRIVDNQVQILIRDTGMGMSSEQLKRIGKPYFSTKESGTGLGLMVVMSLVKAMNGKIIFRSKLKQGTICEIHLGLHEQE
ncbi:ATP-binding protein [Paenibacillus soyae]|uniref:histidine kinase n=1 Tax=Paenibacillus soyae TaxID=2969249 RepID=A0A9X2MY28_9BACL|nr:ATP-binding protein [Paenibacillus soyae]MCR2807961.1 ATP-binding protein [Paenibacillus soyae]